MSIIVRYSTGSTYTLVANKVDIEKVQELGGQYHVPYSSMIGMVRLGLGIQKITVTGDTLDMTACIWHDVVAISLDSGTSYQTVYFSGVPYTSDCWSGIYPYTLELLASPLKERTAVRYPTTGYKWGNQSITGISQLGNTVAYPVIHYLAPLFYAPLSNTLVDFAGQSVTFTRTASKVHGGVTYPINIPIFDSGLYLGSDTAQDVATWTPPASTLRTIAMQIKSRYPSPWSIGGGGINLLTANQSNAETDTTGVTGITGTLSRTTVAGEFYAGTAGFKLVSTGSADMYITSSGAKTAVTAGLWYSFSAYMKSATKNVQVYLVFYDAAGTTLNYAASTPISAPGTFGLPRISIIAQAPAGATQASFSAALISSAVGEILYVDNLMLEAIPAIQTVWIGNACNQLWINTSWNQLLWTDETTTIASTFPTSDYLNGAVTDIVLLDNTAHAVTVIAHAAGGTWYTATGTLAALNWYLEYLGLNGFEGSIANLIEFPYVLTSAEYQALAYSSLALLFNDAYNHWIYIGNRYAGEIIKGSDKRLVNALGNDISALLGGNGDIPIGSTVMSIAQSQGLSARWYIEVKRTDL